MENLPKEKQSAVSFTPPSKKPDRLKFFLFFALGLVILVLIGEGVYYFKLKKEKGGKQSSLTESQPQSKVSFPCPVPKEYCSEVDEIGRYLGFQLPPGTEIRAVMSGTVSLLKNNFGDVVIELRSVSGLGVFYTFRPADDLELSRGSVKVGDVLGKSGDLTQFSLKYNLLISLVNEDSNYYLKPKELFEL